MAFQRLRVERSALAVWFGAILVIVPFGGAQASSGGKFWRLGHLGQLEPIGYVYLVLTLLGAYCIFRGLYGEWWRVVRVDLEARKVKTCEGKVLGFDELGALEVHGTGLSDANHVLIYEASAPDVRHVKALLESLVRRGTPRRLHRLRRLTYHRLPGLFVFTTLGFAILVGLAIAESHTLAREFSYEPEFKLLWLLGFAICVAWFRLSLFGTFSRRQLMVDPVAGVLQLADRTLVPLNELGALSLVERTYRTGRRYPLIEYDLRAANVPELLYTNMERPRTQRRLDALATAILQFELRRVLEAPAVETDAFRSGADPLDEARRLIADSPHADAALRQLARDAEPTVRERAAALAGARGARATALTG